MMPIFKAWLDSLHEAGATTLVIRNVGSTDHVSFDHADPEDLNAAAAIVASFVDHAAMHGRKLSRKPLLDI